ncbi:hypothetical protein V0R50_21140 [Pseudomonas sp. 148P]|uniref:Uncharacterized protein n=1 Tax=Pseudomonas ulcerans TaxID=3115852 RepID=A0ABU7HW84_9PSED|nr:MULTISPECIES: hypothetical protein [unclassified Pseudomonas]MEE1922894.1 hypothetical protein [Pseudomonas sp. 147P]MEE1935744.1 hypothetical protein [Pseudomonas sp. 148P]
MKLIIASWAAGLLGFALLVAGVWMLHRPAAFIVAGMGLLVWAKLADQAAAHQAAREGG